jgi:hypothetical protein
MCEGCPQFTKGGMTSKQKKSELERRRTCIYARTRQNLGIVIVTTSSQHAKNREDIARGILAPVLGDWIAIVENLQQIKLELLREPWKADRPSDVAYRIVARIFNQTRAAVHLIEMGYPLEADTIVTSMAELAYMVGYIGDDEGRATGWMTHLDWEKSFAPTYECIRATLRLKGAAYTDTATDMEYAHYSFLCMAKHGNPMVFSKFGFTEENGEIVMHHGPYVTREVESISRIMLWYLCYFLWLALEGYRNLHLLEPGCEARRNELEEARHAIEELRAADMERYKDVGSAPIRFPALPQADSAP